MMPPARRIPWYPICEPRHNHNALINTHPHVRVISQPVKAISHSSSTKITSSSSSEIALRLLLRDQGFETCWALRWGRQSGCGPCGPSRGGQQRVLSTGRAHRRGHLQRRSWRAAGRWRLEWSCERRARRACRAWLLGVRGLFRRRWCRLRWKAWRRRFGGCLSSWNGR